MASVSDEQRDVLGVEEAEIAGSPRDFNIDATNYGGAIRIPGPSPIQGAITTTGADANTDASVVVYEEHGTDVIQRLASFGGVRQFARMIDTARGNDYPFPQMSNELQEGERLGSEGTTAADLDIGDLTQVIFKAFTYSSKVMAMSRELLQDSFIDLVSIIIGEGYRRLGRIQEKEFTNGTGTTGLLPYGAKITAKAGITAAATTTIKYDELIQLEHAVEYAYREGMETPDGRGGGLRARMGKIGYMVHDSQLLGMKTMKDNDGRPLWLPGLIHGAPHIFMGYPYVVNQSLDQVAADSVSMLFGNFAYYAVRNVTSVDIFRFTDSAFTRKNLIGWLMFQRCDARPVGALDATSKTEAIVKLTQASA